MQLEEVSRLIDKFTASGLNNMEIEQDGFRLRLEKNTNIAQTAVPLSVKQPVVESRSDAEEGCYIVSPVVGTFYAASSPDVAPFVTVGTKVSKSDTVCLIEAMKMMSDVSAPADLIIEEVLVKDGDTVGFNTPLFRYREI